MTLKSSLTVIVQPIAFSLTPVEVWGAQNAPVSRLTKPEKCTAERLGGDQPLVSERFEESNKRLIMVVCLCVVCNQYHQTLLAVGHANKCAACK